MNVKIKNINSNARGHIQINNVCKKYESSQGDTINVLNNLSLDIAPGELNVIMGVSGCGKSTLAYLLAGYLEPDKGELKIDGENIKGPSSDRVIVFQETALWPWMTVIDNVTFGPKARKEMTSREAEDLANDLLKEFGLEQFSDKYPNQLSGGMKRRAEIAQALINRPSVMILDEPFRGLDVMTRELLQEYYLRLFEERKLTTVFITSELDEAIFLADSIYVMADKPSFIKDVIEVDLARPRTIDLMASDQYFDLENRVMESLYNK